MNLSVAIHALGIYLTCFDRLFQTTAGFLVMSAIAKLTLSQERAKFNEAV